MVGVKRRELMWRLRGKTVCDSLRREETRGVEMCCEVHAWPWSSCSLELVCSFRRVASLRRQEQMDEAGMDDVKPDGGLHRGVPPTVHGSVHVRLMTHPRLWIRFAGPCKCVQASTFMFMRKNVDVAWSRWTSKLEKLRTQRHTEVTMGHSDCGRFPERSAFQRFNLECKMCIIKIYATTIVQKIIIRYKQNVQT
jgi:hypothetical protein